MTDIRTEKARMEAARLDRQFREEDERQLAADLTTVFNTETGRRLLLRFVEWSGLFFPAIADDTDRKAAMREGARNLGLRILQAVREAVPDAFRTAEKEREAVEADRKRRREAAQKELSAAIDAARPNKQKE